MINESESARIIGLLYTDALTISDPKVKTQRTRALLTELYGATEARVDARQTEDHRVVTDCITMWTHAQKDIIDGEELSASNICFGILDRVTAMVKLRYGSVDITKYQLASKV
jgi:hypothetical protein